VSAKATPFNATVFAEGLVMVNVSCVVEFKPIFAGLNTLAIEGGATTAMLAEAVGPLPPSLELTALVVLICIPAAVPVTVSENVQEVLLARVAPLRLITLVFCVEVMVPPPQLPVSPLGVETIKPAGSESVKPMPVSDRALGLLIVKLKLVEPLSGIVVAPNALAIDGGPTTVSVSLAVFPGPLSFELTAPVMLVNWPAEVPVTFTTTVQELLTAMLPSVRLMLVLPAVADAVPPQLLVRPFGVATSKPAGSVSLNATPVSGTPTFGFWMVKVSMLVPLRGMVFGLNACAMLGAPALTVNVADPELAAKNVFTEDGMGSSGTCCAGKFATM
jgi:hypothetical protein